ncbi:MAG: hypothetical protein CVU56_00860 [Deltaproteobacteria bacterium HGW-Deltaproteobacteria-14]|jgi:hypothetical protein|nr:MAG: hypothetical protein CVU56_00860 [Deltaproteobacteria bacterium HGW-Deltaproteobacteria-14]PKQ15420.1 MAG: hypothetical protein CVT68_09285 [Actinobacteria bacterium HGW-Actinobacteria-8]
MTHDSNDRGGRTAWIVVGSALFIGTALAVFVVFPNMKESAISIGAEMARIDAQGASMTAEECVEHAIDWFERCDVMPSMCLQEVPTAVARCLHARDRTEECAPYVDPALSARWTFEKCKGRGIDRGSDRSLTKSCTGAWRALDQYCKTGQKGVFWGVR